MLYLSRKIHNMLSILIPVYNINCVSLVRKLYEMALLTEFPFEILLADEISPDTCRFWDSRTGEKLDKDRFRRDMGGVEGAYQEVMRRLLGE